MPNTGKVGAKSLANRIIETFNTSKFVFQKSINISITASLGVAVHGESTMFDNWSHLLNVADDTGAV